MKRLTVFLLVLALALMGATTVMAANQPQALKGVNLATAQPLTNSQAQSIRGASQGTYQNFGLHNAGLQTAAAEALGGLAMQHARSFTAITTLITQGSYLAGLGFHIGAILRFK